MLSWFMVYNHTNYARWGPVYLADIKALEYVAHDVFKEFIEYHVVVRQTEYMSTKLLSG
ncbi:hypothetical protein DPMN_117540 [Dreissena polymorpha]|uniref:Uncharacterized protein n=1 Tax=Dreissena polymorpha TaxID=45954 RepID=A0A9D4QTZ8_DREPO|nr:hypothetical protein DPMN_117092 [Dreissena polymorpha]KAH3843999.1 hypothetical protein DPMN_117540 [Dreissena polymorpha]